jgi:rRNA processing protein Gar1
MLSNNPNRTIDLELSEAGESFYEHNQSIISNVSEVFGRDEFPYEKMQLRRVEQRRLFEKTAAYIKSLKNVIE